MQSDFVHEEDLSDHNVENKVSHLYLGIGGGTLPMLLDNANGLTSAIDIDQDVISLATQHLGFNSDGHIEVLKGDALRHEDVVNRAHSAIFVDIAGASNDIPSEFIQRDFVNSLYRSLNENGVVLANFHRGNASENAMVDAAKQIYSEVFGSCFAIVSRFQGNVIIAAVKNDNKHDSNTRDDESILDVEKARQVAMQKGWRFDPESRLREVKYVRKKEHILHQWA